MIKDSRKTNESLTSCVTATVSHASDKDHNLPMSTDHKASMSNLTKDNDNLDFGSTRNDNIKSQKSFTVSSILPHHGISKTMIGIPKNVSLIVSLVYKYY